MVLMACGKKDVVEKPAAIRPKIVTQFIFYGLIYFSEGECYARINLEMTERADSFPSPVSLRGVIAEAISLIAMRLPRFDYKARNDSEAEMFLSLCHSE
jgi:hypothetical protein